MSIARFLASSATLDTLCRTQVSGDFHLCVMYYGLRWTPTMVADVKAIKDCGIRKVYDEEQLTCKAAADH